MRINEVSLIPLGIQVRCSRTNPVHRKWWLSTRRMLCDELRTDLNFPVLRHMLLPFQEKTLA